MSATSRCAATFNKVKDDPRVQEKTHQAADLAKEKAPIVKDKVAEAADEARRQGRSPSNGRLRRDPSRPS